MISALRLSPTPLVSLPGLNGAGDPASFALSLAGLEGAGAAVAATPTPTPILPATAALVSTVATAIDADARQQPAAPGSFLPDEGPADAGLALLRTCDAAAIHLPAPRERLVVAVGGADAKTAAPEAPERAAALSPPVSDAPPVAADLLIPTREPFVSPDGDAEMVRDEEPSEPDRSPPLQPPVATIAPPVVAEPWPAASVTESLDPEPDRPDAPSSEPRAVERAPFPQAATHLADAPVMSSPSEPVRTPPRDVLREETPTPAAATSAPAPARPVLAPTGETTRAPVPVVVPDARPFAKASTGVPDASPLPAASRARPVASPAPDTIEPPLRTRPVGTTVEGAADAEPATRRTTAPRTVGAMPPDLRPAQPAPAALRAEGEPPILARSESPPSSSPPLPTWAITALEARPNPSAEAAPGFPLLGTQLGLSAAIEARPPGATSPVTTPAGLDRAPPSTNATGPAPIAAPEAGITSRPGLEPAPVGGPATKTYDEVVAAESRRAEVPPAPTPVTTLQRIVTSPAPIPATGPAIQLFAAELRRAARDARAPATVEALVPFSGVDAVRPAALSAADLAAAPLDLRQEQWPGAMVERIERLRDAADAADTRIRLVPDALGELDISVKREGETVHVHFAAEQAATRALLQDATSRLAEAAEARGLRLGQTSVDSGGAGRGDGRQPPSHSADPAPAPARAAETAAGDTGIRIA